MNRLKKWVRDFFSLSHSQANGFIILIPIVAIIVVSEPLWHWYISRRPLDLSRDQVILDSLVALWKVTDNDVDKTGIGPPHLFHFDPNSVTPGELQQLGFSRGLANSIARYRAKGGRFRVKADLLKIYHMDTALYSRLRTFIDLPKDAKPKEKKRFEKGTQTTTRKSSLVAPFDINLADTAQLKMLRGIGEKLSLRIVKYRDALGGFVELTQLQDVYGLDTVVINNMSNSAFVAQGFVPHQININTATERVLAAHPYLTGPEARSIVAYRFQHGRFEGLTDLRKVQILKEETIVKIIPYLVIINE